MKLVEKIIFCDFESNMANFDEKKICIFHLNFDLDFDPFSDVIAQK